MEDTHSLAKARSSMRLRSHLISGAIGVVLGAVFTVVVIRLASIRRTMKAFRLESKPGDVIGKNVERRYVGNVKARRSSIDDATVTTTHVEDSPREMTNDKPTINLISATPVITRSDTADDSKEDVMQPQQKSEPTKVVGDVVKPKVQFVEEVESTNDDDDFSYGELNNVEPEPPKPVKTRGNYALDDTTPTRLISGKGELPKFKNRRNVRSSNS